MDPFHERLARIALAAAASFGFALAGGYAVQKHGFLNRRSDDVDLFASSRSDPDFVAAVAAVIRAYRAAGLEVAAAQQAERFARLEVVDSDGRVGKVELGVDWRAHPPTFMDVGPVLHSDDAVANKVGALFSRGEVRDYIDMNAILASGRYSGEDLLELAADHDPGFDREWFAMALRAVERLPDSAFAVYGMNGDEALRLRHRLIEWSNAVSGE